MTAEVDIRDRSAGTLTKGDAATAAGRQNAWPRQRGVACAVLPALSMIGLDVLLLTLALAGLQLLHLTPPVSPRLGVAALLALIGFQALAGVYPGYGLHDFGVLQRRVRATVKAALAAPVLAIMAGAAPTALEVIVVFAALAISQLCSFEAAKSLRWRLYRAGLWGITADLQCDDDERAVLVAWLRRNWQFGLNLRAGGMAPARVVLLTRAGLPGPAGLQRLRADRVRMILLADAPHLTLGGLQPRDVDGAIGLTLHPLGGHWFDAVVRRALDLAIALPVLLFTAPIVALAALAIRMVDPGPAFYRHSREGLGGGEIRVHKLRTMYCDAEAMLQAHLARDPEARAEWDSRFKLQNDPRILPVDRVLPAQIEHRRVAATDQRADRRHEPDRPAPVPDLPSHRNGPRGAPQTCDRPARHHRPLANLGTRRG